MIGIILATNSTTTAPAGYVSLPLAALIPAFVLPIIVTVLMFAAYIVRKDPTILWARQRKSWGYDVWISPTNDIKILPIMEEDIDPTTNTFDYVPSDQVGYTHIVDDNELSSAETVKAGAAHPVQDADQREKTFEHKLESMNEKREITQFTHKGHKAWIHSWDTVGPHAVTKNSLSSSLTPEAVRKTKDGNVRKQIDSIRVIDNIPKTSVLLVVLIGIVLLALFATYGQIAQILTFLQNHFASGTGTNSTAASTCSIGYIYDPATRTCVPQAMPYSVAGLIIPNVAFSWKPYRRVLSRAKSRIAAVLAVLFLPMLTLLFFVSKTHEPFIPLDTYNYDAPILVTAVIFWFSMWTVGAKIGDFMFRRSNRWADGIELEEARRLFKLDRRWVRIEGFFEMCEQRARIENWLEYFQPRGGLE